MRAQTGNEEEFTPSAVSVVGTQVTLTIPSPGLANGYAAGATVFSVYYPAAGELECTVDNWSENTDTYDESTYEVLGDNIGTDEQTWTIAKLTATTFSCTGDTLGLLATSGSTASDYAPVKPGKLQALFHPQGCRVAGSFAGWIHPDLSDAPPLPGRA